jgi:DNA-binding transcriptional ArsR family regulator
MTSSCAEAGLPAPRFEEIGTHFRVTIFATKVRPALADEMDRKVLQLLGDGESRPTSAIARHIGLSERATLTRLKKLTARGLVVEIGMGPHDPKRQYGLA